MRLVYVLLLFDLLTLFFFFKQKTAYEMRISDWSSDVCSSDLVHHASNDACLDRNYGNVLIIFDRLFGTFAAALDRSSPPRSEERRGGKECVSRCRSRWAPEP